MKKFVYKMIRYSKSVFNSVLDKQVQLGKLERQENWETSSKIKINAEERKQLLEKFIIKQVAQGWRLNAQTENSVVLEFGKKPNHVLHFLLCIPTIGFWLIVWIILSLSMTIRRKTWIISEFGEIRQYM